MKAVPQRRRILDFAAGLFYLLFFWVFYTLPAQNLHALKDGKSLMIAYLFPLIVFIAICIRFGMRTYPPSLLLMFISNGTGGDTEEPESNSDRKALWIASAIAFLLPVSLISFDLKKEGLHSGGYTPTEMTACIAAAVAGFITGIVIVFRSKPNEKAEKPLNKPVAGFLLGIVFAAIAWWIVCELEVMYEMIFRYPEVFRI